MSHKDNDFATRDVNGTHNDVDVGVGVLDVDEAHGESNKATTASGSRRTMISDRKPFQHTAPMWLSTKSKRKLVVQVVRLNTDLIFLTAPRIKDALIDRLLEQDYSFNALLLDMSDVRFLDLSGLMVLKEIEEAVRGKKLKFVLAEVRDNVYHKLVHFGITSDTLMRSEIYIAPESGMEKRRRSFRERDGFYSGIIDEKSYR